MSDKPKDKKKNTKVAQPVTLRERIEAAKNVDDLKIILLELTQ